MDKTRTYGNAMVLAPKSASEIFAESRGSALKSGVYPRAKCHKWHPFAGVKSGSGGSCDNTMVLACRLKM